MFAAVVIPTYNERDNIEDLVSAILALDEPIEIVIVDDNSPDGTGMIADSLAAQHASLHVIHRPSKLGLGTAHIAGMCYALEREAALVLTMDADLSHNPRHISEMVALARNYDAVIGSRYMAGGGTENWPWHRILLSWSANQVARIVLGLQAHDCTSGFRLYRREALTAFGLEHIRSEGYAFLVELLYNIQSYGYSIGETPITFYNRQRGSSKISKTEIAKAVHTVFRLRLKGKDALCPKTLPSNPSMR